MNEKPAPRGFTLAELMVVLVILGVMAGVVGLAWRRNPLQEQRGDAIVAARHHALETGTPTRAEITIDGETDTIVALPDGRIIAPDRLHLDPLTGRSIHD